MRKLISVFLLLSLIFTFSCSTFAADLNNFKKINAYTTGQFTDVPESS